MQDEVLRMEFFVGHLGHRPQWPKLDENRATGMIYEADRQIAMAFRTGCSSGPDHRCYLYRRTGGRTGRRQLRLLVKARAGESRFCASCERHNWGGRLANARRSPRRRLRAVGQNCMILGCEGCPSAENPAAVSHGGWGAPRSRKGLLLLYDENLKPNEALA